MIKKIAAIFTKKKPPRSKLNLEKKDVVNAQSMSLDVFDEYSQRLPGFPTGIPVIPTDLLIEKNKEMIKQIILARGLAGAHNKDEVEKKIMSPIRHLAEMTHLLPASEKNHFKLLGGLFSFCLEVSLFSIRYAERRILTRATPEIRKDEESLWTHAAFLTGLFSEAITAISKISVYAEDKGIEWRPGAESLYEWLQRNELKRYHIRWSDKEDRSTVYIMAGKSIQKEQTDIFATGEKAIYKTLYAALQDQKDHSNPLANIVDTVKYKIMERDEWSYADRYGKPLAGMHLEPWLIDAMRHLVQKKRWVPNDENGRIWHGQDGVFLVWPLAANDMQVQLKSAECPFIPSTQEILADILLDAGIIEKSRLGGYLFDIEVPAAESKEKNHLEALKLARYEILFVKTQHKPIDGNLRIKVDDNEDSEDRIELQDQSNIDSEVPKHTSKDQFDETHSKKIEDTQERKTDPNQEATDENDEPQNTDINADGSVQTDLPTHDELIDTSILFQKPEITQTKNKTKKNSNNKRNNEFSSDNKNHSDTLAINNYDDDYAADYLPAKEFEYGELTFESDKKAEIPEKNQVTIQDGNEKITTDDNGTEDLLGSLIGSSKNAPKKIKSNPKEQEAVKTNSPKLDSLLGKKAKEKENAKSDDGSGRAGLILNRLKKLPAEYLEPQPGRITKIKSIGLKDTKIDLKDCVSVLKASGLLEMIDGYETGLDSSGKPQSRYFLVKADLVNGK
ncbi:MAG: TraI domain-containing protein [Methylomicrobium sp.]|nr:TraI domain-containing protein [Methylomicrobium sp.]